MENEITAAFGTAEYRKQLRKSRIRARDALTVEERKQKSESICRRIAATEAFQKADTVLLYAAVRGEVQLDFLPTLPESAGKRFLYPLCISNTEMIALLPLGEESWQPGYCNIPEPVRERSLEIPPQEIDLAICPCTVFDEQCNRMGMGAGFYDRYLPQCTNATIISVAFECQKTDRVPTAAWDKPMDGTVTEDEYYKKI